MDEIKLSSVVKATVVANPDTSSGFTGVTFFYDAVADVAFIVITC